MRRYGRGIRHTPGTMNKTESAYAMELQGRLKRDEILWWAFEGVKLKLADKTHYTPDFVVLNKALVIELHETKGTSRGKPWIEDDAAVKIKCAAEKFPFKFILTWFVNGQGWVQREY